MRSARTSKLYEAHKEVHAKAQEFAVRVKPLQDSLAIASRKISLAEAGTASLDRFEETEVLIAVDRSQLRLDRLQEMKPLPRNHTSLDIKDRLTGIAIRQTMLSEIAGYVGGVLDDSLKEYQRLEQVICATEKEMRAGLISYRSIGAGIVAGHLDTKTGLAIGTVGVVWHLIDSLVKKSDALKMLKAFDLSEEPLAKIRELGEEVEWNLREVLSKTSEIDAICTGVVEYFDSLKIHLPHERYVEIRERYLGKV